MSRIISFAGIINARDLGGLTTTGGETIRKGLLLRAANLSQATEADLAKLRQDYRLSSVIDLRTAVERKEKPDCIPEDVELRIHPIFDEATAGITREDKTSSPFSLPDMVSLYRTMIVAEPCRAALHGVLTAIFTHDFEKGSVLWHCTAGKDRCGIVSSLVLSALGVSREEIIKDYTVNADEFIVQADALYRRALRSGRPEPTAAAARDVFLALPKYMESAFRAIDDSYGSSESYLTRGLQIPESLLAEFRNKLLE